MFSEMDSEKRRVPKALHHELSEYASLLRALRARDTLDLTKYLAQPSPFALDNVTNEDDDQDTPCSPLVSVSQCYRLTLAVVSTRSGAQ